MWCLFILDLTYRNLLQQLKIKALPIDNHLSAYLKYIRNRGIIFILLTNFCLYFCFCLYKSINVS